MIKGPAQQLLRRLHVAVSDSIGEILEVKEGCLPITAVVGVPSCDFNHNVAKKARIWLKTCIARIWLKNHCCGGSADSVTDRIAFPYTSRAFCRRGGVRRGRRFGRYGLSVGDIGGGSGGAHGFFTGTGLG
jgi:hypothetical protein